MSTAKQNTVAIIPARSGSKGVPDKNIKDLLGKPLIAYSIDAAKKTGLFSEVMVSTDAEHYANVARSCGAAVPFLRSEEMSSDLANSWDAVREVLAMYKERGMEFDRVCLLQPTSPLRTSQDIQNAMKLYQEKNAKSVISVCEADHSPRWMNTLPEDGSLCGFIDDSSAAPRQTLGKYYRLNGAIYIIDVELLKSKGNLYGKDSYAYIMEPSRSVDIDTELDFIIAEAIMRSQDLE